MIRAMYNLRCSRGHYHYSPTPSLWIGRSCELPCKPYTARIDGRRRRVDKCKGFLHHTAPRRGV